MVVFLVFLPPVLWAAAYFTSLREFRQSLRPISLLAIGLVLATTAAVAAVARVVLPGLGWPAALALGAIVSPPDAVAATAIAKRIGLPRRLVTILEGESLLNDATALVIFRVAVVVAVGTAVGPMAVAEQVMLAAGGGILVGALGASGLGDTASAALDAVVPAAFLALLWPRLTARGSAEPEAQRRVALGGAVVALALTPFVPAGVQVIAAVVAVALAGRPRTAERPA